MRRSPLHALRVSAVLTLAAASAFGAEPAPAQKPAAPAAPPAAAAAAPAARPEDVATPEAIVAALYDVISGPKGKARDWDRFRSLFAPEARMIPLGKRPDGTFGHRALTPADYITRSEKVLVEEGFR